MQNQIYLADNLTILHTLEDESVDLIYIDPPFNTAKTQTRTQIKVSQSETGFRNGFGGRKYKTTVVGSKSYEDTFKNYIAFLEPRLHEARRILRAHGTMYFHIDYREAHYCKVLLDKIFGRENFINEIVWAYDFGGRARNKWAAKHDTIFMYAKDKDKYKFNAEEVQRIPYMAPGLVGPEKAARGKRVTDTWWHTIVPTNSREKTGYPTQKPLGILKRIVKVSSDRGDIVLDFFAGSGTTGKACLELDRRFILIDNNIEALQVMAKRFQGEDNIQWIGFEQKRKVRVPINSFAKLMKQDTPMVISKGRKKAKKTRRTAKASRRSRNDISIIAVGASEYDCDALPNLPGPMHDLETIKKLFLDTNPTGLFKENQLTVLENPALGMLHDTITKFANSRTARGDHLIFYFSGHGCTIGSLDFGFCVKDSVSHSDLGVIPSSVFSFTSLIHTLQLINVHPIIIVDACVSGRTAHTNGLEAPTVGKELVHRVLNYHVGHTYALLCACADNEMATDTANGGVFTQELYDIAKKGLKTKKHIRKEMLAMEDIFGPVEKKLAKRGDVPLPKLYAAPSLEGFPFCKNVAYTPVIYPFIKGYKKLIEALWNKGKLRAIPIGDIPKRISTTTYGNHRKLSRPPWSLVHYPSSKMVTLTKKGERFAQGKVKIPREVLHSDPNVETYKVNPGTKRVSIKEI